MTDLLKWSKFLIYRRDRLAPDKARDYVSPIKLAFPSFLKLDWGQGNNIMDNKPNTYWDILLSDPIIDRNYGEVKLLPEYKGKEPKIPDIRITRQMKDVYSKILFIMDSHKNIRNNEVPSVISISSTGFLNIYFKQRVLSKYINRMESLGIISKYQNAHYIKEKVINKETGKEEEVITWVTSNSYIWYPDNEAKIRGILQKEGIKPMQTDKKLDLRKKGVRSINDKLIKFGDTRIERPVDMEPIELIAYINSKLKSVYPLLPVMQEKENKSEAKQKKNKHGYGVRSIKMIIDNLGGSIGYNIADNTFILQASIPD